MLIVKKPKIFDVDIYQVPSFQHKPAHLHFDLRFLFYANTYDFTVGADVKKARWWPFETIVEPHSARSVINAVEKWLQVS